MLFSKKNTAKPTVEEPVRPGEVQKIIPKSFSPRWTHRDHAVHYLAGYRNAVTGQSVAQLGLGTCRNLGGDHADERLMGAIDAGLDKAFGTCRVPDWVRQHCPDWQVVIDPAAAIEPEKESPDAWRYRA